MRDLALGAEALLQLLELERHVGDRRVQLAGDEVAPAVFDDEIDVYIRLARLGRTSATFDCAAYRFPDDVLMVTATQTLVLVDLDERRAVPIPEAYRERIRGFEGDDLAE